MDLRIRNVSVHVDFTTVTWGPADLGNQIGTASFVYEANQNPSVTFVPIQGDDVRFVDDDGTTTLFIGHIAMIERGGDPIARRYVITCQDLNYLFDKLSVGETDLVFVAGGRDGNRAAQIINGAIGDHVNGQAYLYGPNDSIGIASTTINSVSSDLPALTITAYSTLRVALDAIGAQTGHRAVWFLDSARVFHWNDYGALAPFALSTRPTLAGTTYMDNYSEFIDRTNHVYHVRVQGTTGINGEAFDAVAYGDAMAVAKREFGYPVGRVWADRFLKSALITDTTIDTASRATRRAWTEIQKYSVRKTIRCRVYKPGLRPCLLIDIVHDGWGTADLIPAAGISREPMAHSSLKGELAVGARGRYLIQKVTPRLVAKGSPNLYSYDLEMGDYEAGLEATLARSL